MNMLWVGKKSFTAGLLLHQNASSVVEWRSLLSMLYFHCPLCKLIEGDIGYMLPKQFFILDVSFVCSNMNSLSDRRKHFIFLSLLTVMRMVTWMIRMKEVHWTLSLSSHYLIAFFKHQLSSKINFGYIFHRVVMIYIGIYHVVQIFNIIIQAFFVTCWDIFCRIFPH